MTYIELINQFWRHHENDPFSHIEIVLYFYLLKICNSNNWENPFKRSTNLICAEIGISRKSLSDYRNRLKQKGLIDYKEGLKNQTSAIYTLVYVSTGNIKGNILGNINGNMNGNIHGNINGNQLYLDIDRDNPDTDVSGERTPAPSLPSQPAKRKSDKPKTPADVDEVISYGFEIDLPDKECRKFFDHFTANGWKVGKARTPMQDWQAALRNWKSRSEDFGGLNGRAQTHNGSNQQRQPSEQKQRAEWHPTEKTGDYVNKREQELELLFGSDLSQ